VLELRNIVAHYNGLCVLDEVDLAAKGHEITTVIGSNGAGKSTLLKVIVGLVHAARGSVLLEGREITSRSTEEIASLGLSLVPEGREVFSNLTVEENLRLGAYCRRRHKREMEESIRYVYQLFPVLAERRNQLAGTLSGGERQMSAIGRALMSRPRLLLLDEPSMGLSPRVVHLVFKKIQELNGEGMTVLLVEQNCKMALGVAHMGYVLQNGRVALEGAAADLANDRSVQDLYLGGAVSGAS
jgi:branched-chain amino acid transport system ATP-binding protein